jgi:hypothetical protein
LGGEECSCSYAENVVVPGAKVVVGDNVNFCWGEEAVVSDVGSVVVWEKRSAAVMLAMLLVQE